MKKKQNKKNNMKKMIILLGILILVSILVILIINLKKTKNEVENDAYKYGTPIYINEDEGKIYPSNVYALVYRYSGNADMTKVYTHFYNFKVIIEKISENYKLTSSESIESYYKENILNIKKYVGFINSDQFEDFVNECKKVDLENSEFEKAEIDIDSINVNEDNTTFKISYIYTNNIELNFEFTIENDTSGNIYIFKVFE